MVTFGGFLMRRTFSALSVCAALSGCVEPAQPPVTLPGETFYERTSAGWRISCSERFKTGVGSLMGHNECSMIQNNSAASAGLAITANSKGRSLSGPQPVDTQICETRPRAHGVDGVSVVGKSFSQQLQMLASGTSYFKERQSRWPYCVVTIAGEIPLRGFSEAYAIFDREARARGW